MTRSRALVKLFAFGLACAIVGSSAAFAIGWRPASASAPSTICSGATSPIALVDPAPGTQPYARWLPLSPAFDYHRDAAGVPTGPDGTWHPGNTAQAGIRALGAGDRAEAERMAKTLVARADPGMWLPYRFDFRFGELELPAPWYSGFAQGQALALLSMIGDRASADAVFATLRPGSPVARTVGQDFWIEEYVADPPNPVLNGDIFGLFGLWEYWRLNGSSEARDLLVRGIETVRRHLGEFLTSDGRVWYDLDRQFTIHGRYWTVYVEQFDELAAITGEPCFNEAARWVAERAP